MRDENRCSRRLILKFSFYNLNSQIEVKRQGHKKMLLECLLPDGSSRPGSSMTEKASQANAVTQNYTIPAEFQRFFNHPATISPRKRLSRAPRGFSSCAGQSTKSRRPTARPPPDEKRGVVQYSDTTPLCMILFLRLQPERRGAAGVIAAGCGSWFCFWSFRRRICPYPFPP